MEDIMVAHTAPTVLQVVLTHAGHVDETIFITVVMPPVVLKMCQYLGSQRALYVYVGIGIGLELTHGVTIEIEGDTLVIIGLKILHIDLAGDRLIAIAHRGTTLRHLDALHPGAWHIT